jgi:hypothetical protein
MRQHYGACFGVMATQSNQHSTLYVVISTSTKTGIAQIEQWDLLLWETGCHQ